MRCRADGRHRSGRALRALLLAGVLGASMACGSTDDGPDGAPVAVEGGVPDAVRMDGRFDEWDDAAVLLRDPLDAPAAAVDIGEIRAMDDPRSLYLSLDLGREVNAQSMPGVLRLLIDADGDETSGGSLYGMPGVDLVLATSYTPDPASSRGLGFVVRAVTADGPGESTDAYPLGILVAPSFSSSRFELRLSRHGSAEPALPALGASIGLRAVYLEGSGIEDRTETARYDFRTVADAALPRDVDAVEARLARSAGSVRVAQLNVSSGSFGENAPDFARLLAAVEPDVLLLDELPGGIDEAALQTFFGLPPMAALGSWEFALGASGGRQRAAVASRLGGLQPAVGLADVRYAEGTLDELRAAVPERFHAAIDAERRRGVSAAGAWVPVDGRDVLFVAVDLQSTGWIDSPEDRLRVLQAATLLDRARTAVGRRAPRPDGSTGSTSAVVGGDFNLVGSRTPLDVLTQVLSGGGAEGGSALEPVEAERLGERTLTTWRSPGAPFAPGRLDYVLAPTGHFTVPNAFAFTTEDLPAAVLERLGLEAGLSQRLSDHLLVVADLRSR